MTATRLVATCWSERPDELVDAVRAASTELSAASPDAQDRAMHLVEARLDLLSAPPAPELLERLVAAAGGRLLTTCRPGGPGAPHPRADRMRLLGSAMAAGAAACDVEDDGGPAPALHGGAFVLSHHWPADGPPVAPGELRQRLDALSHRLRATTDPLPCAVKLAGPVEDSADALHWLDRPAGLPDDVGWAPVPLGAGGSFARLLGTRLGLALAYFAAGRPLPGPSLGQVPLRHALGAFGAHSVTAVTRVFGVLGWPLEHSWSPLLHSRLFREQGIDALLVPLAVRHAEAMSILVSRLRLEGAAVTMPHKITARALAASESPRVTHCGAVNTLRVRDGRIEAEAFDGAAVVELLGERMTLAGARILVVGAGGAAASAAAELSASGAEVTIAARRDEAAETLARRVGARFAPWSSLEEIGRDALVHATPAGGHGSAGLVASEDALDAPVVLDMVSTPPETALLRLARARGRIAIDGLAMLARQAAMQQAFWLGASAPPASRVEQVLRETVALERDADA